MHVKRHAVTVTTGTATGTGYTSVPVTGRILEIRYAKDATAPYADGVGVAVTAEGSGTSIWSEAAVNASCVRFPRLQVHSTAGAGLTYDGTRTVCEPLAVMDERIKIVVTTAGDKKTGTFYVTVG